MSVVPHSLESASAFGRQADTASRSTVMFGTDSGSPFLPLSGLNLRCFDLSWLPGVSYRTKSMRDDLSWRLRTTILTFPTSLSAPDFKT